MSPGVAAVKTTTQTQEATPSLFKKVKGKLICTKVLLNGFIILQDVLSQSSDNKLCLT